MIRVIDYKPLTSARELAKGFITLIILEADKAESADVHHSAVPTILCRTDDGPRAGQSAGG
jgi:hypothetical protein